MSTLRTAKRAPRRRARTRGPSRSVLFALGLGWLGLALPIVVSSCNAVTGVSDIEIGLGEGGGNIYVPTDEPCDVEGEFEACYPGPPTTRGVGPCADGSRLCMGGFWSQCVNAVLPVVDACDDNIDNDCDGAQDEGCPCAAGASRDCYNGAPTTLNIGACQAGTQECVNAVWATECAGQVLPQTELCDGEDDDCDGVTDDDCICVGALGQDDCDGLEDLGDVNVGESVLSSTGQLNVPTDDDWYAVGFPPAASGPGGGTAQIELSLGELEGYRFDVYLDCDATTPLACGTEGSAADITEWSFVDDQSLAGAEQWTTRDVPWPTLVVVRVHRPTGTTCDDYQLSVTR